MSKVRSENIKVTTTSKPKAESTTARRAAQTMDLAIIHLEDAWALRDLTICVRDIAELRPSARALVESLAAP